MSFRDFLTIVMSAEGDQPALAATEAISSDDKAHRTALLLQPYPDTAFAMDGSIVAGVWTQVLENARQDFEAESGRLAAKLAKAESPFTLRTELIDAVSVGSAASLSARHADLTIMLTPKEKWLSGVRQLAVESVLFGSGRPLLIVPANWKMGSIGRRIVIAWNAKREAARALADAAPLLDAADAVTIVTVDASPSETGHGAAPGADIAAHLARRGLKVELRNVDSLGRTESKALLDEAASLNADLIVMGGYGKARLREMVFGGVTKALLDASPIPLFMSH